MSVFTPVTPEDLSSWLQNYDIGELVEVCEILAGIDNSNFFVTTTGSSTCQRNGALQSVLTLFENLTAEQLPYNLGFMAFLGTKNIPVPIPVLNREGRYLSTLNGKPAVLVTRLQGRSEEEPSIAQCAQVGEMLARMHLIGCNYPCTRHNTHGNVWRQNTAAAVNDFLDVDAHRLLHNEVELQNNYDASCLPSGTIHADLFRNNVLFDDGHISGLIDFYFSCTDAFLYDLAITVNDWCIGVNYCINPIRLNAMMTSYTAVRSLSTAEADAWPVMLRRAALRFWLSRLHDYFLPRPSMLNEALDPQHFYNVLKTLKR